MRSSRVFLVAAALSLAPALRALSTHVAGAQPPSTDVVVSSPGVTDSSTQVGLDTAASPRERPKSSSNFPEAA
jgi:hypothetical protein